MLKRFQRLCEAAKLDAEIKRALRFTPKRSRKRRKPPE